MIRNALADTSIVTGLRAGPESEAIVEAMLGQLHARPTLWALKTIVAHVEAAASKDTP